MIGYGSSMFLATHGILARSGGGGASLLLDTYTGAAVAYSLRQLSSSYTGAAIRVRRSSDNAEQDINFVGGNLDTSSLLTFCGAGNGFVTTWYDQSGNTKDITQATAASQPQIVSSGALIYENSQLALEYNNSYMKSVYEMADDSNFLLMNVFRVNTAQLTSVPRITAINSSSNSVNLQVGFGSTNNKYYIRRDSFVEDGQVYSIYNTQRVLSFGASSNSNYINVNSTNQTLSTTSSPAVNSTLGNGLHLFKGYTLAAGYILTGTFQEYIVWDTDQLSNVSGIETNINDYYSIY